VPFACVPNISKNKINKAGDILITSDPSEEIYVNAYDLATQWRAAHAYPINTFQSLLRKKIREGNYKGDPIVAQRLKRMPTIIDKLKRYPAMNLTTMQDIGGLRAVLNSIEDVNKLRDEYRNVQFSHKLIREDNYILNPRDSDGYRSLHLIYKYKNIRNPDYDGLRVELQIRTKYQHLWATAVETMGTFLGQALKSRQGNQDWLDFFALISSAFSYIENSPQIPKYSNLSKKETFREIIKINKKINAFVTMSGLSTAVQFLSENKGYSYHLIVLDSLEKKVSIQSFDRDSWNEAIFAYDQVEKEAVSGNKIEPVLVSAGKIENVRKAYPSFFLDISDFLDLVRELIIN